MKYEAVNFQEKLSRFGEHWSPKIIAQMNELQFKLVKIQGDFVWHSHPETDEVFVVVTGEMVIDFRDGQVKLGEGELFVVPRGVEHKPFAAAECHLLLVESVGTVNTGNAGGDMTAPADTWI